MHASDLLIPAAADILAAARDYRDSAERLGDAVGIRAIDRLIVNVVRGASFNWSAGVLTVCSPSGGCYDVRRSGCTCENARHGRSQCWHVVARNILEDMIETRAADADDDAWDQGIGSDGGIGYDAAPPADWPRDLATGKPMDWYAAKRAAELGQRLAQARAVYVI